MDIPPEAELEKTPAENVKVGCVRVCVCVCCVMAWCVHYGGGALVRVCLCAVVIVPAGSDTRCL